ncbi:MAG: hypothetical protein ACLUNQ_00885 [Oscillospiraceae bacterium]
MWTKELDGEKLSHVVRGYRRPHHLQPQHPPGPGLRKAAATRTAPPPTSSSTMRSPRPAARSCWARSWTAPSSSTASPSPPRCWIISRPPAISILPAAPSPSPSPT